MRAIAFGSILLAALGGVAACGSDDDDSDKPSGGSGGSGSAMVSCGANPQPGNSCTSNGTCSNATNCFCLSGSISCSNSPPQGNGGEPGGPGGGDDADCGDNPEDDDQCTGGPGPCDGAQNCFCGGNGQVFCG